MTRNVDALIAALHAFAPTADEADNVHRLNEAWSDWATSGDADEALPALFALVERFPDAGFGTPGPLVQRLETLPSYRGLLADALLRRPTELTAWMANRLLNTALPRSQRQAWLQRLTAVTTHAQADPALRESVIRWLDFQASRPLRDG